MATETRPARFRYPDPPQNVEDLPEYLRSLIRALEQNDVALDAVLENHATAIDDLTP